MRGCGKGEQSIWSCDYGCIEIACLASGQVCDLPQALYYYKFPKCSPLCGMRNLQMKFHCI